MRAIAACFAIAASVAPAAPAAADELWLAPGKVRLVITAPADAPLNLAPLLDLKADESAHSIATRVQVRSGSAITIDADGAPGLRPASVPTPAGAPGASSAQAQRDIQQCRTYAQRAAAQFRNSSAKVTAYNNAMQSCLRSFGYTIHSPAA